MVVQASYESTRGSRHVVIYLVFFAIKMALKNLEKPRVPRSQRCTKPARVSQTVNQELCDALAERDGRGSTGWEGMRTGGGIVG